MDGGEFSIVGINVSVLYDMMVSACIFVYLLVNFFRTNDQKNKD